MNTNEITSVPTLGERFKNHPCGQYCLNLMPGLEEAELWQRPVTECLFLRPVINYKSRLAVADQLSFEIMKCWTGTHPEKIMFRSKKDAPRYVRCEVVLDRSLPLLEECQPAAAEFAFNWCEAVLSYDPKLTAEKAHLLARRPWCWSDEDAITDVLTRIAGQNLEGQSGAMGLPLPSRPDIGPMTGFESWESWRRVQSSNVRSQLDLLIPEMITRGFPVNLLAENL